MGVPKFFCYVSERYPCLSELVREFQIPDFDNLYLDMNGIIHACSHPNDYDPNFSITEESIFASIFHYIEVLYNMIKPRKIFFLAVDGVAPRAKMNQQRARRFRSAKDAEELEKKVMAEQNVPPKTPRFDSNCITPGTVFMDSLHAQLKYFISSKISTDPLWQNCKIILSGHQTPGEGEHKIMDYIRYLKTLPEYDPNTRHCLYGLDADLIMLGLCTHEPHFSLLREKVQFGKSKNKRIISPDETQFYLLHLSLMREYIDLEFQELKEKLSFEYNLENIIDDWVLMGFLVGNDFIPHLPGLHINKGALPILYKTYKAVLPSLDGYLNENGYLNLPRFQVYMEKLGEHDMKVFEETYANLAFLEEKTGKSNSVEEKTEKSNSVEEKAEKSNSVEEKTEKSNSVEEKTEKSNSVEEKTEKSNSVEEKTEESNSVEEKTEKSNSVEEKTEKSNSVEEKTEKSNSVEEKTEKSNSVEEKTEKSNSVEEKTEKSNSVEEKTEKSNSVEEKTEKSNSVEEKTEKSNSVEEQPQPQPAAFKNSDLEKLIKATNELFVNCDGEEEELLEDDNETFIVEFHQHKKDYYTSKLDYSNVTEEVLKSQAEGYIRAIQWNLHYYYQGCQSWSWFYPHHYAPYISDIKNFKDLKLDFELGKPFLPFEQLLAVLPAASKKLLPKVYQDLMTSPNSPIKDFYPTDFATDLNGKSQEWEAVVLIPLIDEKRLLKAMEPFNDKLTKKERKRNTHGPMHVFTYTEKDLGLYKSPQYFPSIVANHAVVVDVDMKEISVDTAMLRYGLRPGVHLDVFYPGFPTFKHIPHTSYLKACHLKIFDWFSRGDSMVLTIGEREFPPMKELAKDYLGKVVYVNWPHLVESKVVAIADEECKYTMTEKGEIEESILNKDEKNVFLATCTELKDRYFKNLGIEIGEPEVIVYVNGLNGRKYIFGPYGKVTQERIWSVDATPQPLQTVVKDLKVAENSAQAYYDYLDVIPIGSKVFMMGQPHFGSMGTVLDSTHCMKNERLKISFEIKSSPVLDEDLFTSKMVYMPGRIAAIRVGISTKLFAQITGCIFVGTSDGKKMENFDTIKVNIGLNMKHSFRNEELPGYTKKENDTWLYSAKAVELAVTYVRLFPHIVEKLSEYPNKSDFLVHEMFPNTDGISALLNIINWIKSQDHYNVKPVKVGSEILETEVVDRLTDLIDKFTPETVTRVMHVKPRLLYKSDLVCGNLPPVENAKHFLFDRVVSIRSSYTVPLGLRGFIIAKHIGSTPSDYLYDVLFDRPFVGGSAQNTAPGRVFRMTSNSFLNISDKNRGAQGKTVISSKTLSVSLEPQVKMKPPMYQGSDEVKEKPTSAFALWNQQQNIVNPPGERVEDDHFREIWQNLQNAKPDEERTGLLKQILKIDEKKAPVIEEPVKLFFQKVSSSTKALPPFENCQNGVQEGPILSIVNSDNQSPNRYCVQLFSYYQRRNMGQPRYHYIYSGNKIIAQIMMWDGKVFSGLPCDEKVCASESAALQALAALGEFPINHCDAILRRGGGGIATAAAAVGAGGGNENNVLINDNVSMKENNHLFGRDGGNFVRAPVQPIMSNVLPFNIPPPPSQWVEYRSQNYYPRPMPPPPPQPFFRNIDGIGNMNQIQGNPPDRPQDFVRPLTTGSKVSAASLGFVPLQAITGKRNVGVIPTRNYYKTVKKPSNPSEDYKPDVATVSQPSGTPTPSVKPRRRPKIAANLALDENLY